MAKSFSVGITISVCIMLSLLGCQKKETVSVDNETQSVVDNSIADQEFMAIIPAVNQHAINTKGTGANASKSAAAPCDTLHYISGDTSTFLPNPIYTMEAGNSTCAARMPDGKIRSGQLSMRLTGKLKNVNAQMIVKLLNYKASGISYSCDSLIITTVSSNTLYTVFNVKLVNGICQNANWKIKCSFDKTITFYKNGNPVGTDAYTSIYGTASGINRQGRLFTATIPVATPLIKHKSCEFIDKGILELTPDGYKTRSVDFGDGTCDDLANYSVNGNSVAFKLK
jgi:hypothetical protein